VVSKDSALGQCRQWLAANLPGVPVREVASTTLAAERAAREHGVAAIASEAAAKLYQLSHVIRCIEDRPDNATRFIVLGHEAARPSGDDRTSVVFSLRNESGSLYQALLPFKESGVNLTRIESRPSKKINWEYSFFVDMEGHAEEPKVKAALAKLRAATDDFRVLGSYPRAEHRVGRPPKS
jgi:chorismate mutase / prephenate dehydratase